MDPLAYRVARRFTAELLTKQWLMGVRRGWLSLMKPSISDFKDVYRALGRLQQFVENLRAQIQNVRRALSNSKIDAAFDTLLKEITNQGGRAEGWSNAYEGKIPWPSEDERKRGEYMLNLYKTDFSSATSGDKSWGNRSRIASLTEFLDDLLKLLYESAKYLEQKDKALTKFSPEEENTWKEAAFREFDIKGVKVIVVDPAHKGARILPYVHYVMRTHDEIARKGFSKVWYGAIFLMSDDYEKLSKEEQEAYAKAGYKNLESRAGTYHSGSDVIRLTSPPGDEIIRYLAHELGHRYWAKFMSGGQRARFESVIEGDWSMVHAILLNHHLLGNVEQQLYSQIFQKVESGRDLSVDEKKLVRQKFKELGLHAGVPLVSEYAHSRPTEAFAEVFERYVVEDDMTRDQVDSFRSVLASDFLLIAQALREEPCPEPYSYSR